MESIACDVVIMPEDSVASRAIETSKSLEKEGTLFTLDKDSCQPHVSIYMLQLKVVDLGKVSEILKNIAQKTSKFSLETSKYFEVMQFIDAEYQKTAALETLQRNIINELNPLRDGMRQQDRMRMEQAEGLAKEYFEKYGTKSVFNFFRPHLTFTRFMSEQTNPQDLLPEDISQFNGIFTHLGLFETGENGTCVRKIAAFELR
jgi:2'-5' RNA ligase